MAVKHFAESVLIFSKPKADITLYFGMIILKQSNFAICADVTGSCMLEFRGASSPLCLFK